MTGSDEEDDDEEEDGYEDEPELIREALRSNDTNHNRVVIASVRNLSKIKGKRGKITREFDEEVPKVMYLRGLVRSDWRKDSAYVWTSDPEEAIYDEDQEFSAYQVLEKMVHISGEEDTRENFFFGLDEKFYDHPQLCRIISPRGDAPWEFRGPLKGRR